MPVKLLIIILCISLLFLASCSSDNQTSKESAPANKSTSTMTDSLIQLRSIWMNPTHNGDICNR